MNSFHHNLIKQVTYDYIIKLKTELTPLIWGELKEVAVHKSFYVPSTPYNEETLISTCIVVSLHKIQPNAYKVVLLVHNPKSCYEATVLCSHLKQLDHFLADSIATIVKAISYTKNTA